MIGVAVSASERALAKEFFELFKTPWEFYRPGAQYAALLCTAEECVLSGDAPLALFFGGEKTPFDAQQGTEVKVRDGGWVGAGEGKKLPVYGRLATFTGVADPLLTDEGSRETVAFLRHRGTHTTLRIGFDLFSEVRLLLTAGQPARNAGVATLDELIALLREWLTLGGMPVVEIPPVPDGHRFAACLTHDVDHPVLRNHWCDHTMFGFLYRSLVGTGLNVCRGRKPLNALWKNWGAACLLPFVHLGVARDFWGDFDQYLDIEAGHGSTFFVIPEKDQPGRVPEGPGFPMRACRYDVDELRPQLRRILAAGGEVGVHGLDAWMDADAGRREREKISRTIGTTELGVRMHWLFFDGNSPAALDRAGFVYDSTVGYRETVGYRAGTLQVYRPPGVETLLELPLHVMDTALFYPGYLNLDEQAAERLVGRLLADAERLGGALTINWHDRSIAPERLWDVFYLRVLRELKDRGAWLPTASQAVAWFRKRRATSVEATPAGAGLIKVRVRTGVCDALPGLRVRVYKPRIQSRADAMAGRTAPEYAEVPVNCTPDDGGTTELNIPI